MTVTDYATQLGRTEASAALLADAAVRLCNAKNAMERKILAEIVLARVAGLKLEVPAHLFYEGR